MQKHLPAISGLADISNARVVLYQSGQFVHGPYGTGLVSYLPQTLTPSQQAQVQANIGITGPGPGGDLFKITYITASGTFNVDADTNFLIVEGVAGGGAGGSATQSGSTSRAAPGGTAGAYGRKLITNPALSYSVTIGAGGAPGAAGDNPGGNGGNSVFDTEMTLTGGLGGPGSGTATTDDQVIAPAAPSTGSTGGDLHIAGEQGGPGLKVAVGRRISGRGGNSRFGTGGVGVYSSNNTTTADDGGPGLGFGAGGGGASSQNAGGGTRAGGAGAPGVFIVYEYR